MVEALIIFAVLAFNIALWVIAFEKYLQTGSDNYGKAIFLITIVIGLLVVQFGSSSKELDYQKRLPNDERLIQKIV